MNVMISLVDLETVGWLGNLIKKRNSKLQADQKVALT